MIKFENLEKRGQHFLPNLPIEGVTIFLFFMLGGQNFPTDLRGGLKTVKHQNVLLHYTAPYCLVIDEQPLTTV